MSARWKIGAVVAACLVWAAPARADDDGLQRAYLKELAFLKAEKAALAQRATEVAEERARRMAAARAELEALQTKLLTLRQRSDDAESRLREGEVASNVADRAEQAIDTLGRAREALAGARSQIPAQADASSPIPAQTGASLQATARPGAGLQSPAQTGASFPIPALADDASVEAISDALTATFDAASTALREGASVRREEGAFFLKTGEQVEGSIVRVGRVAAFGVADAGAGALVPAGAGRMRLWDDPAAETAHALLRGEQPSALRVFLFESADTAIEKREEKSLEKEMAAGGLIAYVIVALGLIAVLMVAFRGIRLLVVGSATKSLADEVVLLVGAGRIAAAKELAAKKTGAAARVLQATLRHLNREREALDDLVHEAVLHEVPAIERFGSAIVVFAAVAPLLGLLGTVTGMISTFDIITEFGTGDPRMLSGGISEALITTKFGLVVAIPALLLGTLLNGRADAIVQDLQHSALRVINVASGMGPPPARDVRPEPTSMTSGNVAAVES